MAKSLKSLNKADLIALLEQVGAEPVEDTEEVTRIDGHYFSPGFLVTGKGDQPTPGTEYDIPTKSGTDQRIEILAVFSGDTFNGKVEEWVATSRRVKAT